MESTTDEARASRPETFPKADRIRRRVDFKRVQSLGERVHAPHYVVMVLARTDSRRRVGMTITKRVGHAVDRNRVKRVLREVFRRHRELFPEGADVVIIAKQGAPTVGYHDALAEVTRVGSALRAAAARSREKRRRLDDPEAG
jgi:ribonuclease P protein component